MQDPPQTADDPKKAAPPAGETPPAAPPATEQQPGPVPYQRFAAKVQEATEQKAAADALQKRLDEIESAGKQAEEKAAVERGEWEKLANERQAKLEKIEPELKSLRSENESLKATVQAQQDAAIKSLPDEIKDMDPGIDDLTKRQVWIDKALKAAEKITAAAANPTARPGVGAGPPKAGSSSNGSDGDEAARAAQAAWTRSRF